MGEIRDISEGPGYENNEDRILRLNRQIAGGLNDIRDFEDIIFTAGDKATVATLRRQIASIREEVARLIKERNMLQVHIKPDEPE